MNTIHGKKHCHWFNPLLLLPTLTIWFSLNRKQHSHKLGGKKRKHWLILTPPIPLCLIRNHLQSSGASSEPITKHGNKHRILRWVRRKWNCWLVLMTPMLMTPLLTPNFSFTRSCKSTLGTPLKTPSLVKTIQLAYFALAGAPLTSSNQTWNCESTIKSNPNSWKLW